MESKNENLIYENAFLHSFKHCYCSTNVTQVTMEWPFSNSNLSYTIVKLDFTREWKFNIRCVVEDVNIPRTHKICLLSYGVQSHLISLSKFNLPLIGAFT